MGLKRSSKHFPKGKGGGGPSRRLDLKLFLNELNNSIKEKEDIKLNLLNDNQKRNIEKGDRIINNHLTEKDIDAAINDIKGEPVININTGKVYNHLKEVEDAIKGLNKIIEKLNNSLKNPNLNKDSKITILNKINEYEKIINKYKKRREK